MSELKATPGPWTAVPTSGDMLPEVYAHGVSIFDISGEEANANAHLIASAPDLYEALVYARDNIGDPVPIGRRHVARKIDAALARARGDVR